MNIWDRIHHEPLPSMPYDVNLADVQAFEVSDVMNYWGMNEEAGGEWRDLANTFPNVAPPFRRYFVFGKRTQAFRRETIHRDYEGNGVELGVLFIAVRLRADGATAWEIHAVECSMTRAGTIWVGDRDTGLDFAWHRGALRYFVSATGAFLHASSEEDGKRIVLDEQQSDPTFDYVLPKFQDTSAWTDDNLQELCALSVQFLQPFWLATSLMHCKNVTATRESIPPKLAKAAAARGRPRFSYSVLDIKPMTRVLETEGGIGHGVGIKQALHICRGHFKDYRDGRGLFGRHKGLYWWEQNLRGSLDQGVHDKDYRVKIRQLP